MRNDSNIRSHLRAAVRTALPALLVLLLAASSFAQVERASIVGTITDNSGAALPGVNVEVTNEATGTSARTVSDSAGSYSVPNLMPASYRVRASRPDFREVVYSNFVLQVSQAARLDIRMEIGEVQQIIEVSGAIPLLQTENASVGQVISQEAVNSLPLNGRNFVQLAILAPGVSGLDYAQPNTINSGRRPDELRPGGTALQANGARNTSNQVLIDGVDNTEMISQTFVVRPAVEGIQEFKVLTNNAGAEYGRAGGAVVVITTKSGGNQFHGSLFEFLRNEKLDARNFFANPDFRQPPFKLNQFGGSLSGPIQRNKTFFFADYEGYREVFGDTQLVTVPTAAMKAGNFAGVAGIFDPLTTRPNPAGAGVIRDRFPNDVIPRSRFDPIGSGLVQLWPDPQTAGRVNNFVANPVKRSSLHRADGRVDRQMTERDMFFFRYSIDRSLITMPDTFDKRIGGNEASFAGDNDITGKNLVAAWTHGFTPSTIGDFRYGYTQFDMALMPTTLTDPIWNQIRGRDTTDPFQPSAPIIGTTGYAGLGNARSTPLIRNQSAHQMMASVSTLKNRHNIKFGGDLRFRLTSETASPPGESAFGRWNFDPAYSRNPASPGGTGDTIATMLMGYPIAIRRDVFPAGTAYLRTNELNFYIRDEWRVNNRLTLNFGLHYEINTPFVERNNQWVNFDPATGTQLIAGQGGVSRTGNVNTDFKAWGPRASFAYQVNSKTVLRGGYGIFYEPQGNFATNIRQFRQPPFGFVVNLPQGGNDVPTRTTSDGFPVTTTPPNLAQGPALYALRGVTPNYRNGQVQQFNVSAQREVGKDMVVTLGFVGSASALLSWNRNINQPDPGPGNIQARRPFNGILPGVTNIAWLESAGNAAYTSMQLSFEKRMSRGLYLISNWTWAHGLDNGGWDGGANGPIPQDPANRRNDWANSNSDIRHRINTALNYQLPFARNMNSAARHLLAGWEVGTIMVLQTGLPFTVTVPGSPANTGSGSRANPVPGVDPYPEVRTLQRWFNPAAFTTPPQFTFGTLGRNTLRAPGIYNYDLSAGKKFRIKEGQEVTFRAEFFNAFNHPQFGLPAGQVGVATAGTINSTQRANRQIQFALRYAF
ncbi:MAG: carboxypeptidase regulatory-like domain-containing protein [Bryobacteraceae bacterium]